MIKFFKRVSQILLRYRRKPKLVKHSGRKPRADRDLRYAQYSITVRDGDNIHDSLPDEPIVGMIIVDRE